MIREKGGGEISPHTDGRGRRVEGGARRESFTAQTGPLPYKFQRPARLHNHFVPVIHH